MISKLSSQAKNHIWNHVPLLTGCTVLASRCILCIKLDLHASQPPLKAQLVVKRCKQQIGIHYAKPSPQQLNGPHCNLLLPLPQPLVGSSSTWML